MLFKYLLLPLYCFLLESVNIYILQLEDAITSSTYLMWYV